MYDVVPVAPEVFFPHQREVAQQEEGQVAEKGWKGAPQGGNPHDPYPPGRDTGVVPTGVERHIMLAGYPLNNRGGAGLRRPLGAHFRRDERHPHDALALPRDRCTRPTLVTSRPP